MKLKDFQKLMVFIKYEIWLLKKNYGSETFVSFVVKIINIKV